MKNVKRNVSATIALYIMSAAMLSNANPRNATAADTGGQKKMKQETICPLLTTNTVVEEYNTVKIGTQPVLCVQEQCAWWIEDKQKCAIAVMGGKR